MSSMFQCALATLLLFRSMAAKSYRLSFPITHIATCGLITSLTFLASPAAHAVTPESPEVRELIDKGLAFLETSGSGQLGGKCLIALAFHKDGSSPEHPQIAKALHSCEQISNTQIDKLNNYSIGIAIILLAELDLPEYRSTLHRFAESMFKKQKSHGGWGYSHLPTGDTSQTQYAVLSFWELLQNGIAPNVDSVESCLNWFIRTQSPEGAWGYQGNDPGNKTRVAQEETTLSMAAAGLGSTLILSNILGLSESSSPTSIENESAAVPSALKRADFSKSRRARKLSGNSINREQLAETITLGQAWYKKKSGSLTGRYPCYVLYSIERCKSFEELMTGDTSAEPDWYQQGYNYLKSKQLENGSWTGGSGSSCATSFALLFLMRSTQKSIQASLGEGTLIGGRGLQADLSRMKLERGRLVSESKTAQIGDLIGMLTGSTPENLEQLLNNSDSLRIEETGPEDARRLQQLAKSGVPEVRIISVRILAKQRNLDHIPTLLYAMTDPDNRVVREARDGVRFISRRFQGFGLPDNFTETERYDVIDKWKRWYSRVRPTAPQIQ